MDRQAAPDGRIAAVNVVTVLIALGTVALLGLAAGASSRQGGSQAADATARAATAAAHVDRSSLPVSVPLQRHGGHLLVDVSLEPERPPVPMLLDTGAPTLISPGLAAAIGAQPVGRATLSPLGASAREVDLVRIPELRIGGARFSDVPALVAAPPPGSPLADLVSSGIVGSSLLAAAVWQVDYQRQELTIAADLAGLAPLEDGVAIPDIGAPAQAHSPVVSLSVGGATVAALVDTGSEAGLVLHPSVLGSAALDGSPRSVTVDGWDYQHRAAAWTAVADVALRPGRLQRRVVHVTSALPPDTAILGNGFLAGRVLTIDLPTRLIHVSGAGMATTPRTTSPRGRSTSSATRSTSCPNSRQSTSRL